MKKQIKILITTLLFVVFCGNSANAQFFNKLKKSVETKVEKTVINKTSDRAAKRADKTLDKAFDPKLGDGKKDKKSPSSKVEASYEFKYKYRLKITTSKKDEMLMDYYVKPGATYMGVKMNVGPEMFMIMDGKSNINHMFLIAGNSKIVTSMSVDSNAFTPKDDQKYDDYKITNLPNKKFLGYDCIGRKMENKENVIILYVTKDGPVNFNEIFKTDTDRIPAALKNQLKGTEKGTLMYMDMKDKLNTGKKDKSSTMECTLLEPTNFTFLTAGYSSM